MITPEWLAQKRRVALAATQGEWQSAAAHSNTSGKDVIEEYFVFRPEDDVSIAADILDPDTSKPSRENAAHIAAFDPPTALLLLDEIEKAYGAIQVSHQQREQLVKECDALDAEIEKSRKLMTWAMNQMRRAARTLELMAVGASIDNVAGKNLYSQGLDNCADEIETALEAK